MPKNIQTRDQSMRKERPPGFQYRGVGHLTKVTNPSAGRFYPPLARAFLADTSAATSIGHLQKHVNIVHNSINRCNTYQSPVNSAARISSEGKVKPSMQESTLVVHAHGGCATSAPRQVTHVGRKTSIACGRDGTQSPLPLKTAEETRVSQGIGGVTIKRVGSAPQPDRLTVRREKRSAPEVLCSLRKPRFRETRESVPRVASACKPKSTWDPPSTRGKGGNGGLGIVIATFNMDSYSELRMEECLVLMKETSADIVCLTSTQKRLPSNKKMGGGYIAHFSEVEEGKKRKGNVKGGVGFILSPGYADLEVTFLSSRIGFIDLAVGGLTTRLFTVYAPVFDNSAGFRSERLSFMRELEAITYPVKSYILAGDFNAHIAVSGQYQDVLGQHMLESGGNDFNFPGEHLLDFCSDRNLVVGNSWFEKPHDNHFTYYARSDCGRTRKCLDLVIVTSDLNNFLLGVTAEKNERTGSDHSFVWAEFIGTKRRKVGSKSPPKVVVRKLADLEVKREFQRRVRRRYHLRNRSRNADALWEEFRTALLLSGKEVCGESRGARKDPRPLWFQNPDLQNLIKDRNTAKREMIKVGRDETRTWLKQHYADLRDQVRLKSKELRRREDTDMAKSLEQCPRSVRTKRIFGLAKKLREGEDIPVEKILAEGGEILTDSCLISERWRRHFDVLLNGATESSGLHDNLYTGIAETLSLASREDLKMVKSSEVLKALKTVKTGKSPGLDEVSSELLKFSGRAGLKWLSQLFNCCVRSCSIPSAWKQSVIVPIYKKKGNQLDCANYRPISLLSTSLKLYERLILNRVERIIEPQLLQGQCGFRRGRGSREPIVALSLIRDKYAERQKSLFGVFVDLKSAYDLVSHKELFKMLPLFGIEGHLLSIIKSLYDSSTACVRVGKDVTGEFKINRGLKQGSVISPYLFLIYFDHILKSAQAKVGTKLETGVLPNGEYFDLLLYADDLLILSSDCSYLQKFYDAFNWACREYKMVISVHKTECMVLSGNENEATFGITHLEIDELGMTSRKPIKRTDKFTYLGVCFTSDGKWDTEWGIRIGKATGTLRMIEPILTNGGFSSTTKTMIINAIIIPILTYGCEAWPITERILTKMEAVHLRSLRLALGLRSGPGGLKNCELLLRLKQKQLRETLCTRQFRYLREMVNLPDDRIVRMAWDLNLPKAPKQRGHPRTTTFAFLQRVGAWKVLGRLVRKEIERNDAQPKFEAVLKSNSKEDLKSFRQCLSRQLTNELFKHAPGRRACSS